MKFYLDPSQLTLQPISGEDGWFVDTTTFKKSDGSPQVILLTTDKRGVFATQSSRDASLPMEARNQAHRVWKTVRIPTQRVLPLCRFRDPHNRWSVNISPRQEHYKITVEAENEQLLRAVLGRIKNGTFEEWNEKLHADARDFRRRRRQGRPGRQHERGREHYKRPKARIILLIMEDD